MARFGDIVGSLSSGGRRVLGWIGDRPVLSAGSLLAALLAFSLAVYAATGTQRIRRVLFFPDPQSLKLVGEEHFVPRARGEEESLRVLVKELLLGPASYELARLLPRTVALRALSVRERVLYVDFSTDMVLDATTVPLAVSGVIQGVANNVYFNFPRLRGVHVFIHGQVPQLPDLDTARLAYSRDIVR